MFRKSKKFIAMALAVAMMMSMSTSVFAVENTDTDGTMFEEYNPETGETSELFIPSDPSAPNYTLPSGATTFEGVQPAITPYNYRPGWTQAPSISSTPYDAVVQLDIVYGDGSVGYGTGFVVGDGKVVTAAHCLYNRESNTKWARSVKVSFGKNGSSSVDTFPATTQFTIPTNWTTVDLGVDPYTWDFGFITVPKSMTDKTSKFGLYAGVYVNNPYTITGYPYKKGIYSGYKMYTDTANATVEYNGAVKHDINVCVGVSGAPMYGSNNYAVAIQTRGWNNEFNGTPDWDIGSANQYGGFATLITQSVIDFVRNN